MATRTPEQQAELDKFNARKRESTDIMDKYPRQVIKGVRVELDANWKKAVVASFALTEIYNDIAKKRNMFMNQMSEKFTDALFKETKIPYNPESRKELELLLRLKNLLISPSAVLKPEIIKLDTIIMPEKDIIQKDALYKNIFLRYVANRADLKGVLDKSEVKGFEIDPTLIKCFQDAIAEGINLEMIEKETLATVDTKGDIKKVLKTIYDSVGLETDIN